MSDEGGGRSTLFIGRPAAFGDGSRSAIRKSRSEEPVWLSVDGLGGDRQADRTHHGGVDRALCQHPVEHLPYWRERFPDRADAFVAGAFGENLASQGWVEDEVRIGDVFRLGDAWVQVCQPRQPCWKVNQRFGIETLSRAMVDARRSGWLCRVLEPGRVPPEPVLRREQMATMPLTLSRLWDITVDGAVAPDVLLEAAAHPALAEAWRLRLRTRAEWLLKHSRSS